jgi:hypothetical protein
VDSSNPYTTSGSNANIYIIKYLFLNTNASL